MCWDSGRWRRLRDGWRVKLVDEDTRWYLSVSRTKLRQDVRCNVVSSCLYVTFMQSMLHIGLDR
jgi:hypothetical protein